jgi:hypothetical protein
MSTLTPDQALEALKRIRAEFDAFIVSDGAATEADTRAKLVDRVLKEVCGWAESAISREPHVESGYIDYRRRRTTTAA